MSVVVDRGIEDALPDPARVREVKQELDEAGVKYVLACWVDLLGIPKTKPVPIDQFEKLCAGGGPQFAVHSISMVPELGPADGDQVSVPDLDSLVVCPWNRELAWVFADLFYEGAPYNVCPRQALKRQSEVAGAAGYEFYAGIEPEFTVLRYDENGSVVKAFDDDPTHGPVRPRRQAFGYDAEFSLDAMPFLDAITACISDLGWGLSNLVAEGAYSQFELDFGYADVLTCADRYTLLRVMLKEVAKKRGLFVSYMPKPTNGDWRSGAHINVSVQRADAPGINLFEGESGEWGAETLSCVAGLIGHADSLSAITCPTVNSYAGLVARVAGFEGGTVTWAPTHATYGYNNRSTMLRLPQARKAIENRACDMTMNGYLALAMTVGACLEGIGERLAPGEPLNTDAYALEDTPHAAVRRLPRTLLQAVEAFDADALASSVLGPVMHRSYSTYKHDEWERFHQQVTPWERDEYLRFF
jgi:glutamine synthetase